MALGHKSEYKYHSKGEKYFALKKGDKVAFAVLYKSLSPRLSSFIFSILRNEEDTLDILQNVFLKIWDTRKKIDFNDNFESYIYTIARNMIYNFLRAKVYRNVVEINEDIIGLDNGIEDEISSNELLKIVNHLFSTLPEHRRKIFLMSRVENMTYKQIAIKLNISENTVDTQIRRVLKLLRTSIPKDYVKVVPLLYFLLLS